MTDQQQHSVKVWDLIVRGFHWTLVTCIFINLVLDGEKSLHLTLGYFVIALIGIRLFWGMVGTEHARFSSFVKGPAAVRSYLQSLLRGKPEHHLGHNPAGGLMVVCLLVVVLLTAGSGALLNTDAFWGSALIEELHEALADFLTFLIAIHVAGVVVSSWAHKENLVKAMITGRKMV